MQSYEIILILISEPALQKPEKRLLQCRLVIRVGQELFNQDFFAVDNVDARGGDAVETHTLKVVDFRSGIV